VQQFAGAATPPHVSVVVCTRDRGDRAVATVRSVLRNRYPHFDVTLVDQSETDLTHSSARPLFDDPRVHYLRTRTSGLATARNLGVRSTQGPIVAFTDDDCEVSQNWVSALTAAFAVDSRIGVVFGNVLPGSHDPHAGFIPTYVREGTMLARGVRDKHRVEGIGACMGLTRAVWQALGGFDRQLGAGAPLLAAEETDFTIRALLSGYFVYETPEFSVTHHGFRAWDEQRPLVSAYLFGIGAMHAKHLKCGYWPVAYVLLRLFSRWALAGPVVDFGVRPPRLLRLVAFLRGGLTGFSMPVDATTGHFSPAENAREGDS
jgi:GT2 family glycosyltransferase